jgi:hypothetical protein
MVYMRTAYAKGPERSGPFFHGAGTYSDRHACDEFVYNSIGSSRSLIPDAVSWSESGTKDGSLNIEPQQKNFNTSGNADKQVSAFPANLGS